MPICCLASPSIYVHINQSVNCFFRIYAFIIPHDKILNRRLVDVSYSIRDSQWIFLCHALLLFSDRSLNPIVHGWENNHSWLANILRQVMYGTRVTPLWPHKYAHGKKSAMIMLSGHFKTLIFYKIFDVLSSKLYGDHCRSLYINTFPFDRVLSPINRYQFELTHLVTEIPLFVRPV